jgi:LysR family transcriptional regulator, glycine cleavage system transcriptional activator
MLPDFDSLRCFEAAARHLNFRAAAEAVHLSPTAFSDRIRRLEEELGGQLFERTTRKVRLTASGLKLVPQARRCLEEAERCALVVAGQGSQIPFELVIGTRFELGLSWLVPALSRLEAHRPERSLHLAFGDGPDLLNRVQRGSIDAAITSTRLSSAGFSYLPLHEEDYVFVGERRVLAKQPIRAATDAIDHVLIDAHPDLPLFRYFRDACPPSEVWAFRHIVRLGAIGAIRQRVLEGAGIAVLPRYLVAEDLARKRLAQIMPRITMQRDYFRLIWHEGHALESEMNALAKELRAIPLR